MSEAWLGHYFHKDLQIVKKLLSGFNIYFIFILFYLLFFFLGPHPRHMDVPRLGVESELQPPAYDIATAMRDPNHISDLRHS